VIEYYIAQAFNGLVSGGFIAMMSIGLTIIFGMLRVVNFMHGAMYMLGAFVAYVGAKQFGLSMWSALIIAPVVVGLFGALLERLFLRRLYGIDTLYNLLLTFGLTLMIEDGMRVFFGVQGSPYQVPPELSGAWNLGFMLYPKYRLFVLTVSLVVCLLTWYALERTKLGALIRASTERPNLVRCFGVRVSLLMTGAFGYGTALAGLAGVLAAPMRNVSPLMGQEMIAMTFAVVVIGGMGSIAGSIVTGFVVGILSALGALFYPPIANTLIYILMVLVLVFRPGGIFYGIDVSNFPMHYAPVTIKATRILRHPALAGGLLLVGLALPWLVYPVLASDIIIWGLAAVGFDLLLGFTGLLSFGQAAFLGAAAYVTGIAIVKLGLPMPVGVLAGVLAALILGIIFGALIIRKQGIYFALLTFAFAQIVYFVVNQFPKITGGEDGLHGVHRGSLLGFSLEGDITFYYVALTVVVSAIILMTRIVGSPYGLSLTGSRENENRMTSLGYDVRMLRFVAYVLSALVIGVSGVLYILNHEFITLQAVYWRASGEPVMMTMLGGMGTLLGPLIGAGIILLLRDWLAIVTSNGNLVLGGIFVLIVLVFRKGVLGEFADLATRYTSAGSGNSAKRAGVDEVANQETGKS
jgi:branched-chain amino acid transport system permease protein